MNWQEQEEIEQRWIRHVGTVDWVAKKMLDLALVLAAVILLYTAVTGAL